MFEGRRDDLIFDIAHALRSTSVALRAGKRDTLRIVAARVVDHLELCGWRIEHDPRPGLGWPP